MLDIKLFEKQLAEDPDGKMFTVEIFEDLRWKEITIYRDSLEYFCVFEWANGGPCLIDGMPAVYPVQRD